MISGRDKRRRAREMHIARGFACHFKAFVLDEPTVAWTYPINT